MKYRKFFNLIILALILMAFQCEDEAIDIIKYNTYKANVTAKKVFTINDTIWVEGKVSAMAFNETTGDSIFNDQNFAEVLSIHNFITPEEIHNTEEAINKFKIISEKGNFEEYTPCEKSGIVISSEIDNNSLFYNYKIGLIPTVKGDFVIDFLEASLKNRERNVNIAENYTIEKHPNQVGFKNCESLSWLLLIDSKNEYFFTVE